MKSAQLFHLRDFVLEAADYLAGNDREATEQLQEAAALLLGHAEREAANEREAAGQAQLPGILL